jgi:hypothetical protein
VPWWTTPSDHGLGHIVEVSISTNVPSTKLRADSGLRFRWLRFCLAFRGDDPLNTAFDTYSQHRTISNLLPMEKADQS